VPNTLYKDDKKSIILDKLHKYVGKAKICCTIKAVDTIERGNHGKFKLVESKVT
jgi:hypothetical protein